MLALGPGPGAATGHAESRLVTGAGPGGGPHVRVFDGVTGVPLPGPIGSFFAYDAAFAGGVRVASCDLTGDGTPDVVTGAGPGGGPHVRVFDGVTGAPLPGPIGSFFAYDAAFAGGVFVACGDVNGDTVPDIVTGAGPGGSPHVRVFDGVTGAPLPDPVGSFFPYDIAFAGGVSVAACDLTGDGLAEVVTGAGPGGGPHVRVFDPVARAPLSPPLGSFFAYDAAFAGGVFVACGDVNGDTVPDIVTGAGPGGGPHVRVFDGATGAPLPDPVGSFFPYDVAFAGGVSVAACDLTGDGPADIVTGAGPDGGPHVRVFDPVARAPLSPPLGSFLAYDAAFAGGVHLACAAPQDVNQPPVNTVPGPQTTVEDTPLTFSSASGTLVAVADADAGPNPLQVTLAAVNGTLTLAGIGGLAFSVGDGSADPTMTFTGTIAAINTALDGLTFTPTAGLTGTASVTITTNDQGHTGSGGPRSDTDTVTITATPDPAPTVLGTTPADGASSVAPDANLAVTFSEPVSLAGSWFQIACATSGVRPVAATAVTGGPTTFTINPNADFSSGEQCTVTIFGALVADQDTHDPPDTMAADLTFAFGVTVINEPPVVNPATFSLPEHSPSGTLVGTVSFTDPNAGQTGTFAITTGNTGGAFAINASTGQITVATSTALNFETTPSFSLTVQVTDDGGPPLAATATVTVNLSNVNDAPVVSAASFSVPENSANGTLVGTATFTDPDAGQTGTFAITAGNTGGAFAINASTGQITVATGTALDFETTPSFSLTVQVTDNGGPSLAGTATVTVTLTDVNDPPVALAKSYSAQANMKVSVPAGTGLKGGATDPDDAFANLTVGSVSATSPGGGTIAFNATDGAFDFDPPPGVTGNVTFTYTVCDDGLGPPPGAPQCSAPATVTVSVAAPVIWFVNAAGGAGDGRLSNPFNALAAADAVDAAGQHIFLFAGTYATGLALNAGGRLIGQGVSGAGFDAVFGITPPAGTIARPSINGIRPTVQGTVVLAASSQVRGLDLSTGAATGLSGGAVAGVTVEEASVTTTTGTAVSLNGTGGTFTLTSVSANGAPNGLLLQNTTGSFTVTGTGGACTAATPTCTGGHIQNTVGVDGAAAGSGIRLSNAQDVSIALMRLNDHPNFAISGSTVAGFAMSGVLIDGVNGTNAASPFSEGGVSFTNLTGSATIADSEISGGVANNVRVVNTGGSLDRITFSHVTIGANDATNGNDGILLEGQNDATLNVTVEDSIFTSARGDLFSLILNGDNVSDLVFTGNALSNDHPAIATGGGGLTIASGANVGAGATLTFDIDGNTFRDAVGHAILIVKSTDPGSVSGSFTNNTIGDAATANSGSREGSGLRIQNAGLGTVTAAITGNTILEYNNFGLEILAGGGASPHGGTMNLTITGNTISAPGDNPVVPVPKNGIHLNAGTVPGDTYQICMQIGGAGGLANSITGSGALAGTDFRLRQRQATTVRLPGYAGANGDDAAVVLFVQGNNADGGPPSGLVSNNVAAGGGGFVGGAACPL